MKPRHKVPTPKQAGITSVPFLTKLKNTFSREHNHNHQQHHAHAPETTEASNETVHSIAIVLDGVVHDILRTKDKLADILLAQPTFVLLTEESVGTKIGYKYVDGKFVENDSTT
jgi:hypothetical protein